MSNGIVESYTPLSDIKGSYTAQFEHVSATGDFLSLSKNLFLI
jgi:methionine aminopeptidase